MRINITINEDLEFVLNKQAKKRRTNLDQIINEILTRYLEDYDDEQYGVDNNTSKKEKKKK